MVHFDGFAGGLSPQCEDDGGLAVAVGVDDAVELPLLELEIFSVF